MSDTNTSTTSILGQARSEGYRKGWSQAAQVCRDDAHDEGRLGEMYRWENRLNGIRFRWFMVGVITTASIWWLV
ncbi:hypothetical protein [Novosphingobium mathurense]|uniref:Uncharacterized protein n=1 Tax=Novosphingobium mathurense TaxID=428990 RepID=A0A1U6I6I9_9SPHN|nr:hypothetical protein [Novosphingobium mathurense]SLK03636.1 hypothetical protein SAMN06295987_104270 [Novosphingobium mathurense]